MRAVGVKVLKARLSEYLRIVKSGETVLVTERDEIVAELRPAHRQPQPSQTLAVVLEQMSEGGDAVLASLSPRDWQGFPKMARIADLDSAKLLNELREE